MQWKWETLKKGLHSFKFGTIFYNKSSKYYYKSLSIKLCLKFKEIEFNLNFIDFTIPKKNIDSSFDYFLMK